MKKSIIADNQDGLTINRAKLGSLTIYEITEQELETLEKGGPDSTFLNFAIFTSSIAISFLITLLTVQIESNRVFVSFFAVTILGFLSGFILLILWWRNRKSLKESMNKIRERMPKK